MTPASAEQRVAIPAGAATPAVVLTPASVELQTAEPAGLPAEAETLAAMVAALVQAAMAVLSAMVVALAQAAIPAVADSAAASTDVPPASSLVVAGPQGETQAPACFLAQASLRAQASFPVPADSAADGFRRPVRVSCQGLTRAYPLPAVPPMRAPDESPQAVPLALNAHRLPAGFPPPFADAHGSRWQTAPGSASPFAQSSAAPAEVRRAVHSEPLSAQASADNSVPRCRRYSSHACCC